MISLSKFFEFLYEDREGYIEVRQLFNGKMETSFYRWPSSLKDLEEEVFLNPSKDAFMGVLLRKDDSSGKADNCEEEVHVLWADLDKKHGTSFADIMTHEIPVPNVVVDSGHGWHLYWKLSAPVSHSQAQRLMENISDLLNGDRVGDPARILRVPYSLNNKDVGSPASPVRILRFNTRYGSSPTSFVLKTESRVERLPIKKGVSPSGTRSEELYFVAIDGLLKGKSSDTIYEEMLAHPAGSKLLEMRDEHRRRRWVKITLESARKHIWKQPRT